MPSSQAQVAASSPMRKTNDYYDKKHKKMDENRLQNLISDDEEMEEQIRKKSKSKKKSEHKSQSVVTMDSDLGMIRSEEDRRIKDEGMQKHAFNILISNRIGNHRKIPDTRFPLCKNQSFLPDLPPAAIIICFYNEALSTLLRTIHSVLERTEDQHIYEIILIDDFSDDKDIKFHLLKYVQEQLPHKVRLIRTPERSGLIRARNFAVSHTTAPILVFLDSHVEVNVNWLPPLLERIVMDRSRVVCPIIDIINANTFEYTASPIVRGGFNWGLHFKWDSVPSHMLKEKSDFIKPIPTPTMAGGLYAIDAKFFKHLGGYDRGMDIWGGENIEMSFRVWMCNGSIEIVQCSRVGHVFRQRRPYGAPDGTDTMTRNSIRLAEVWMDDYKKYFYQTRSEAKRMEYGDVSERKELRKRLQCKSFDWYMKEVYGGMDPPDLSDSKKKRIKMKSMSIGDKNYNQTVAKRRYSKVLGRYQIQLSGTDLCIESENEVTAKGSKLILSKCLAIKRQLWSETELKELKLADMLCLDSDSNHPILAKCHELGSTQHWRRSELKDTPIYNEAEGLCLGVAKEKKSELIILTICDSNQAKKWNLITRRSSDWK